MAIADRTKVSLRGQQATPLTRTQADANFDELRKVIDDVTNLETKVDDLETGTSDVITAIQEDIDDITQTTNINSAKISSLESSRTPPPTDLSTTPAADQITVTSSTGNSATLPLATTSNAGLFAPSEKTKLNSIGSMGQRNVTISTDDPSGGDDGDIWIKV